MFAHGEKQLCRREPLTVVRGRPDRWDRVVPAHKLSMGAIQCPSIQPFPQYFAWMPPRAPEEIAMLWTRVKANDPRGVTTHDMISTASVVFTTTNGPTQSWTRQNNGNRNNDSRFYCNAAVLSALRVLE